MDIKITNVGFNNGAAFLGCQVGNLTTRGHLEIEVPQEEYIKAMTDNTLIDLAAEHITNLCESAAAVQEVKITEIANRLALITKQNEILTKAMLELGQAVSKEEKEEHIDEVEETEEVVEEKTEEV